MMQNQPFYSSMTPSYSGNSYPMTPMQSQMPSYLPAGQNQGQNQNQNQMQQPENGTFRTEYQGVLHGLNCWVNLMYAGLGMVSYGRTFFDMSVSVLRTITKGVVKILLKLFGFQFLGKMMNWLSNFRGEREAYNELWAGMMPGQGATQSKLGQILLGLRIVLLLGMGLSYILKRKLEKQQMMKKKSLENCENVNVQELSTNLSHEISSNLNTTIETKVVEEIKTQNEEKMEKALDEEINKTKEVYMNLRSEDFWNTKTPFQQEPVTTTFEETKDEKIDFFKYQSTEKLNNETKSQEIFKNEALTQQQSLPEVKKEKITAPAGSKPWKTAKKAI